MSFVAGDLRTAHLDDDFDAIVSRFIFMHLPEPTAALGDVLRHLRPGGLVVAYEQDISDIPSFANPDSLDWRAWSWVNQGIRAAGSDPAIGYHLHQIFIDAGLAASMSTS